MIKLPRQFHQFSTVSTERIDSLINNFEKSVQEMKRFLQESGYSRRHFFNDSKNAISRKFEGESQKFKLSLLNQSAKLTEFDFSKSILSLGSIYQWKEAEVVFNVAKMKFPTCSDVYSAMIYAYGKVGEYSLALKVFEEVVSKPSNSINKKMFEGLLEAYSVHVERQILIANSLDERALEFSDSIYRQARFERVLTEISMDPMIRIYNQMLQLKFLSSISTLTRIIRLAGRLRRYTVIEDMLRESERFSLKFDAQAFEVLIFAQMQCGRSEEAEDTLKKALNCIGHEEMSRLLDVMLFGYCRLRRPLEATKLLKRFEDQGLKPSSSALSFLIGTAAKSGIISDAEEFYQKLKQQSMHHSDTNLLVPAANHLLAAYLRDNNFEKFFTLIEEFDQNVRDQYTNTMLFDALSRCKNQQRLSKEIEHIKKLHVAKTNLSCMELSALFRCLFTHFEGDDVLIQNFVKYIQDEIKERSDDKRKELQLILLDVFSKLKEWDRSVELVETLISSDLSIVDPIVFAKLMTAAGANAERIEFVLNWMGRVKCWRDPAILTAAMDLYWQAGYSLEARDLWEEIKCRRNKARSFSVAIAVQAQILLKEDGPAAALNHLNTYQNLWNDTAVQVYLKASRLSGSIGSQEIERFFFDRLVRMNPPPSIEVCNEVLIFIRNKQESLERVVEWMCLANCHANVQTMNVLLAEIENRNYLGVAAERLLSEMLRAGAKPSDELLLRIISGQLEHSKDVDTNPAESNSKILLERPLDPQIRAKLYLLWYNYFVKSGQTEKANEIQLEINKIGGI